MVCRTRQTAVPPQTFKRKGDLPATAASKVTGLALRQASGLPKWSCEMLMPCVVAGVLVAGTLLSDARVFHARGVPPATCDMNDAPPRSAMAPSASSRRDRGITLVELVVAIALLGIAGVAVLGAMAAAARGSSVNKSQAGAVVWLQSSADYLASAAYTPCVVGQEAQVDAAYQALLQDSAAPRSQVGWPQADLSVVSPVLFWNGSAFTATCAPTYGLEQVTLRAVSPNIGFAGTLVVVKSNG